MFCTGPQINSSKKLLLADLADLADLPHPVYWRKRAGATRRERFAPLRQTLNHPQSAFTINSSSHDEQLAHVTDLIQ